VNVITHNTRLSKENAVKIVSQYDLILDGCDNFDTRYLLADLCEAQKVPLITAAVGKFDGSITTLKPYENDNPSYRDIFPQKPPEGLLPNCAEVGVIGALTGVLGSMQALEAIKEIVGIGEGLVGTLLLYDAKSCEFQRIKYKRKK
jgi:adenylyltransferase/sulfurtransferase